MKKEIEEIITIDTESILRIKKLPIFYLSLASKELFHSNFIYWLSTIPNGIETLKKVFGIKDLLKLEREKNGKQISFKGRNLTPKADLVGYNTKNEIVLVIENKVKDIPNKTQLQKLQTSFGNNNIKYVILSFVKPLFKVNHPLVYVPYKTLKDVLLNEIGNFKKDKYYHSLIKDYVKFLTELQKVINSYKLTGDYDFAYWSNRKLMETLNEIKLWENYQRIVGQEFSEKVQKQIKKDKTFKYLLTNSSINHQRATINFYFVWGKFEIGIQIENNQFRRFIYGDIKREDADKLRIQSLWFTDEWKPKRKLKKQVYEIKDEPENGFDEYMNYGSYDMQKKGLFLYKYDPIFSTDCRMDFIDIVNMIKENLSVILDEGNRKKIESIMNVK
jgi:hypothetical protein